MVVDTYDVYRGVAWFGASVSGSAVHPAVFISRLASDGLFDLGQQLARGLYKTPAVSCASSLALLACACLSCARNDLGSICARTSPL